MIRAISAAMLALCLWTSAATAAPSQRAIYDNDGRSTSETIHARRGQARSLQHDGQVRRHQRARHSHARIRVQGTVIGGRPAGCPQRFCGCATSIKVFGRIRPELNLAANWVRKFPRTVAAPGMAAARSGHVMVLMEHVGADRWKVWDPNSGGGRIRIHVRSIRGFAVVNPHATRLARL